MKDLFVASFFHEGVLGGVIYLLEDKALYRTNKLQLEPKYRSLDIPYGSIENVGTGRALFFPTVTFSLKSGVSYRFIVFGRKRYAAALLLFLFTILVTWLLTKYRMHDGPMPVFFRHRGPDHGFRPPFKIRLHEQGVWFLFVVVTVFSIAVSLLTELYRQMLEKKELEQEKSRAELALYKAQINPHFLFNTLNTLYSLVISRSDQAEQAFVQFTEMMKYLYSNASSDFIPLTAEAEYIRQYIGLQKFRLNEHTKVDFNVTISDNTAVIAPMLLITFVENAFKYGVSSHNDSVISIRLVQDNDRISFNVRNSVFPELSGRKGDGIGLANCRKRLALIYPDAHRLSISDSGDAYEADLTIMPKKHPVYDKIHSDR